MAESGKLFHPTQPDEDLLHGIDCGCPFVDRFSATHCEAEARWADGIGSAMPFASSCLACRSVHGRRGLAHSRVAPKCHCGFSASCGRLLQDGCDRKKDDTINIRLAAMVLALGACAASPALAITVTGNSGCTSLVADITSTINYNGRSTTDPAGYASYSTPFFNQGTNPGCVGDFLALTGGQSTTVTFSRPVDYVGFVWGTPDGYNYVRFYDGASQVGSTYTGANVTGKYTNFFAGTGEKFTKVVFSSGNCCFETDNFSYRIVPIPEPESYAMLLAGLGLLGFAARRKVG